MEPPESPSIALARLAMLRHGSVNDDALSSIEPTTDTVDGIMAQVPGHYSSSSFSHGAKPPPWVISRTNPARDREIPDGTHRAQPSPWAITRTNPTRCRELSDGTHGAQPSPWATARIGPARDREISDGTHVLEENEFFFPRRGRLVALPQARRNHAPAISPFVIAGVEPLSSQHIMLGQQTLLQAQHKMPTQGHLERQSQALMQPATYGNQESWSLDNQELRRTNRPIARQPHSAGPPGLDRGSIPLIPRQGSAKFISDGFEGCQGYSNLRQNAKRVPHPKDTRLIQGGRNPITLRACIPDDRRRIQNPTGNSHDGRHLAVGNVGNYQENARPSGFPHPAVTHANPGGSFANYQQNVKPKRNLGPNNQHQFLASQLPLSGSNDESSSNRAWYQGNVALEVGDKGTSSEQGVDDVTPRRRIADTTVSASAPDKLADQAPFLRSSGLAASANTWSEVAQRGYKFTLDHLAYSQQQQTVGTQFVGIPVPTLQERPPLRVLSIMPPPSQIVPLAVVPYQAFEPVSHHLSIIAPDGKKPSMEVACDPQNFPFMELAQRAQPTDDCGVVRISNIPYSTTRSEIIAFLGRNADLVEDKMEPIHIIMDRVTGKTLDAFIEFKNVFHAVKAADRHFEIHRDGSKGGRLGNRFVTVEVCGLEMMMRALFPKTQNCVWHGAVPQVIPVDANDRYNTGFKGFITPEELVMLVKYVQDPKRIQFSERCPQRPFECMISTIAKFPWYMPDYITIDDRDEVFKASLSILKCLMFRMSEEDLHINGRLFKRMVRVILNCPGFTESQKDDVAFTCNIDLRAINPPLAPMADHWYVFKTIGPKPGVQLDVLQYYIALIREATTSMEVVTLAQRGSMSQPGPPPYFGNINIRYPPDVKSWTLSQVARIEWDIIDGLLRLSLSRE